MFFVEAQGEDPGLLCFGLVFFLSVPFAASRDCPHSSAMSPSKPTMNIQVFNILYDSHTDPSVSRFLF